MVLYDTFTIFLQEYGLFIVQFLRCYINQKPAYLTQIRGFLLSMGYEKDIFAVFAYEFELLHNRSFLVKSFAYAHGEIIYSVNFEI